MKKGYLQTEMGMIPEDWELQHLGQCLTSPPDYGIGAASVPFDSRYPAYLRITDITEDGKFSESTRNSVAHPASSQYLLNDGDIVFARTGASVGKSYLYDQKDGALVFAGFLIRVHPDPEKLVPLYLWSFAQTRPFWNWVKTNSVRSGQPGINGREYASLPIPIPPTPKEQELIANALDDTNALIESLENLIAKKREIQKGAMQELLTGKTRLPGFTGKWGEKRIGEIGYTYGGLTGKSKDDFGRGSSRFITFMNIMQNIVIDTNAFEVVDVASGETQNIVAKGDLFFNGSSETPEEVGLCALLDEDVINVFLNSFCFGFRLYEEDQANGRYLAYLFRSSEGRELMRSLAQGAIRYNLSKAAFLNLIIPFPEYSEQVEIAGVLSDMDAELSSLADRLKKSRDLREAMMQELLTGRTRLI